jgi:hypothetical protein
VTVTDSPFMPQQTSGNTLMKKLWNPKVLDVNVAAPTPLEFVCRKPSDVHDAGAAQHTQMRKPA